MKNRTTTVFDKYFFILSLLLLLSFNIAKAQTISPKVLPFNTMCSYITDNTVIPPKYFEFNATFDYSGFPAGTTFVVELSDNTGSFTTPITTTTTATVDVSPIQKKITFTIPSTIIGSPNYKLRVKSSTGVVSGNFLVIDPANPLATINHFSAYHKVFVNTFTINNIVSTATFCPGGSYTLSIDNPTSPTSPAFYSNLSYIWYKDNVPLTGTGTNGKSLVVNTAGAYSAVVDYGPCIDPNINSNKVTVSLGTGSGVTITSSSGTTICPGTPTTLTTEAGHTYQWSKDGAIIAGATANQYVANQPGKYLVAVNLGGCTSNPFIDLLAPQITASVDVPAISQLPEGSTKTITVTTNATSPTYQWYQGATIISGATSSSYTATIAGSYKVVVTQTTGCVLTKEIVFVLKSTANATVIPNLVSPNGDGINDFWEIPVEYAGAEVLILSSQGNIVVQTNNYQNDWPQTAIDFNAVNPVYYYVITKQGLGEKKGAITVVK